MKFSDIKKHHKSSYHITVFWKDLSRQLQSYQKEYDLDFSPHAECKILEIAKDCHVAGVVRVAH